MSLSSPRVSLHGFKVNLWAMDMTLLWTQPLLPLGPGLMCSKQPLLPLDVSVLQQSQLPLEVYKQPVCPWEYLFYTAAFAALTYLLYTWACAAHDVHVLQQPLLPLVCLAVPVCSPAVCAVPGRLPVLQRYPCCLWLCLFCAKLWVKRQIAKSRAWIENKNR